MSHYIKVSPNSYLNLDHVIRADISGKEVEVRTTAGLIKYYNTDTIDAIREALDREVEYTRSRQTFWSTDEPVNQIPEPQGEDA